MSGDRPAPALSAMTAADLDRVLEIERASFSNPWSREMFAGELGRGAVSRAWVLRDANGVIVAYCLAWLVAGELHISNLAVAPERRRQGFGMLMLRRVLADAAADGGQAATLEVRESNKAALDLYLGLGFRVAGVRRRYYSDPVEDALVLWLASLPAADLESRKSL